MRPEYPDPLQVKEWTKNMMVKLVSGVLGIQPLIRVEGNTTRYEWNDFLFSVKLEESPHISGYSYTIQMKGKEPNKPQFPKLFEILTEIVKGTLGGQE